jgi:large subunit ribosomal protein L18
MGNTSEKVRLIRCRQRRIRVEMSGTPERPRLRVHRTLKHIYAQIIDDTKGHTLAAASSMGRKDGGNIEGAKAVGKAVAEAAKAHSIECVCFDRGGNRYHGRIKALADAAREAGLQF